MDQQTHRDTIDIWLVSNDISQEMRDKLWSYISEEAESVLEKFYGRLEQSSHRYLLDNVDVEKLKQKQFEHWKRLFLHPVDGQYRDRLRSMHAYHLQAGLSNAQYVAAYFFLMNMFQRAILRRSSSPKEAYALIATMNSILAEDIARALSDNVHAV